MAKLKLTPLDAADYLKTPADIAAYLEVTFEESGDDSAEIARALGTIARAKGMTKVARDAGLSRESLYKALSGDRSPDFATVLKVVRALGLKLTAEVVTEKTPEMTAWDAMTVAAVASMTRGHKDQAGAIK